MKKDFVLQHYVYAIADLPPHPPVLFDSQGELALIQEKKEGWKAISLWLRNIVLYEPLSPDAYKGKAQYYQPYAEFWAAMGALTAQVYPKSANPLVREFSSPAKFWYHCISVRAKQELDDTGLTGEPFIAPKRENYKAVAEFCSLLEKHEWQPDDFTVDENLEGILLAEAQALAEVYKQFHYHVFRPFLKEWRRIAKSIKYCKHLQDSCLLPDGSIFTTGKDRKLPPAL